MNLYRVPTRFAALQVYHFNTPYVTVAALVYWNGRKWMEIHISHASELRPSQLVSQ